MICTSRYRVSSHCCCSPSSRSPGFGYRVRGLCSCSDPLGRSRSTRLDQPPSETSCQDKKLCSFFPERNVIDASCTNVEEFPSWLCHRFPWTRSSLCAAAIPTLARPPPRPYWGARQRRCRRAPKTEANFCNLCCGKESV